MGELVRNNNSRTAKLLEIGESRMKKALKIIGIVLLFLSGVWLVIYLWPTDDEPPPFITLAEESRKENQPLVIAHRGGARIAPEGTLEAMDKSVELGVGVLEFDVHLTEDEELVVIHDDTVDRTTNGSGLVNEMSLDEIQELDAGYTFQDEDDEFSYRDQGVYIPSLREVFERYPDELYLIEIKDTNRPDLYDEAIQKLWALIQKFDMHEQVTVGSFTHGILERFQEVSDGQVAIGAGESEATGFVVKSLLRLNGLNDTEAASLQLPTEQLGIDLTRPFIRETAHQKEMHVYYWTINDEDEMIDLINKEVDGIMTDYPDVLIDLLNE
mgnify:CR=1 FL=1